MPASKFVWYELMTTEPAAAEKFYDSVVGWVSQDAGMADGQPYSNRYISVVVIKDRKVTEWRDYLDPLRVFAALEGRPFEPDAFAATDP